MIILSRNGQSKRKRNKKSTKICYLRNCLIAKTKGNQNETNLFCVDNLASEKKNTLIISVSNEVLKSGRMWVSFLIIETFHQFLHKQSCTNAIRLSEGEWFALRMVVSFIAIFGWHCKRQWPSCMMHFLKLYLPFIRIVMGNRAISSRETI